MSPSPAFSGDISIMSSKAEYYKSELNLSLNTTDTKQQEFTWIPQVPLSTQTLPLALCLSFLSVSALLAFVSVILWLLIQSALVCSFSLSGFPASSLCSFKSPLSINQSWCNVFTYVGHLFCNGRDHRRVEIKKMPFLCLHKEIHKNIVKSAKLPFIGLQILSIPPYNPLGSAFGRYRKSTIDLCDCWSNGFYPF